MKTVLEQNIKAFIGFRIFFNARFYYPVFAILFLDYGLTLEQFAFLNIIWAITIVCAEVPSGALADIIGRKNLIVFASSMMVIEMAILAIVPIGQSWLLVSAFAINRICSGLAEAAASGADEALAYDSLSQLGRESEWPHILEKTSRYLSIAFFTTMILGAVSYDSEMLNQVFAWLGFNFEITQQTSIRLPIYLTLFTSLITLFLSFRMTEVRSDEEKAESSTPIKDSIFQIGTVAKWTLNHRFILFVILGGIIIDSVARQLIILGSEYYRTIGFEPAYLGFIGAGMALLGVVYSKIARLMAERLRPLTNFYLISAVLIIGLIGCSYTIEYIGVLFAAMVFSTLGIVAYLQSYYINQHAESKIRATVISFKGLALNLALGIASVFYSFLIAGLKKTAEISNPEELKDAIFVESLAWFPGYYLALFVVVFLAGYKLIRSKKLL